MTAPPTVARQQLPGCSILMACQQRSAEAAVAQALARGDLAPSASPSRTSGGEAGGLKTTARRRGRRPLRHRRRPVHHQRQNGDVAIVMAVTDKARQEGHQRLPRAHRTRPATRWRGWKTRWASTPATRRRSGSRTAASRRPTCYRRRQGLKIARGLEAGASASPARVVGARARSRRRWPIRRDRQTSASRSSTTRRWQLSAGRNGDADRGAASWSGTPPA